MRLVLCDCARRKIEHPAEGVPDAVGDCVVIGSPVPN